MSFIGFNFKRLLDENGNEKSTAHAHKKKGKVQTIGFEKEIPQKKEEIENLLKVTDEQATYISNLEQGTVEWLNSRRPNGIGRLTGSVFSGILGFSPYQSQQKSLKELIFPTFKGNFLTRWGSDHEDFACDKFQACLEEKNPTKTVQVNHFGLLINSQEPFLAYSPDGDVKIFSETGQLEEESLLEIKCPGSPKYKNKTGSDPIYGIHDWPNGKSGPVPINYWFQIQLGCYVLKRKRCYFCIWIPTQTQVFLIDYDESYFLNTILPLARDVYWNKYIPMLQNDRNEKISSWMKWKSTQLSSSEVPAGLGTSWYSIVEEHVTGGGIIALKDTGGDYWQNKLVDATCFEYNVPKDSSVDLMLRKEAKDSNKKWTFRLYKTTYAKDHYLGEWLLNDSIINGNKTKLQLFRSQTQSDVHEEVVDVFRSRSESNHELFLSKLFPGFNIVHEPEASIRIYQDVVMNGKEIEETKDNYTIDFVVSKGPLRVSFESKSCWEDFGDVAKTKCRLLRDGGYHCVFGIVGSTPDIYYFGNSDDEETTMDLSTMRKWVSENCSM